jgi:CRISPR/Cas system-associated endoribonuclease Cas2
MGNMEERRKELHDKKKDEIIIYKIRHIFSRPRDTKNII